MSLYPQTQGYAQVGYAHAGPAYPPHQPPPQPPYYGVTQAMFYADPTHFRRDYAARLGQLTFNSRPHIQSLSMIAQDYTRYADIVVQCVEQHIRRVSHRFWPFSPDPFRYPRILIRNVAHDVYGGVEVSPFFSCSTCMYVASQLWHGKDTATVGSSGDLYGPRCYAFSSHRFANI